MTVREEVRERIERDALLAKFRKKIESGKGTYADTAAYSIRAGKLLGEIFSRRLPEIPLEEREPLCVDLLHDQYIDINVAVDTVQRFRDEAQGFHLAPQHAPFDSKRGHQIGSSLRDLSKPVEVLQRRAKAAPETAVKAIHDGRMKTEAKFRHNAGLDCRITRVSVNGCCPWCSKVAGRYVYGEEPDDIYRRHDNCDCTVTFENGRKRQDVWSKREWEVPGKDAGAGEPVVLTEEQAKKAGTSNLTVLTAEQAKKLQAKHDLTILPEGAIIETERAMHFRNFNSASAYMKKKFGLSISSLEEMPLENLKAVSDCIHRMYRDIPKLDGFINRIVLADMPDIAKATVRWHGNEPEILLKLSREYFTSMSIPEIEAAVQAACNSNIFTMKSELYGIFKHESVHFAEYYMTFKKYGRNAEARASLDHYELASQIIDQAFAECEIERSDQAVELYISIYACENAAELLAESYSSESSNPLVDAIKRIIRKKWRL